MNLLIHILLMLDREQPFFWSLLVILLMLDFNQSDGVKLSTPCRSLVPKGTLYS
jgi:hypothetical protein